MARRCFPGLLCSLALIAMLGCDNQTELIIEHLRRGDAALGEGRPAQALSAYGHAHELAPHDARVQQAQTRAQALTPPPPPSAAEPTSVGPTSPTPNPRNKRKLEEFTF